MKKMRLLFLPLALALVVPASVLADTIVNFGDVVALPSVSTAGDVVLCGQGVSCSATTPASGIVGVGVFYLSFTGPFTPDVGPADTVTLLGGAQLNNFLTNFPGGFSANASFLDVASNGLTSVDGFTFNTNSPTSTPEPGVLMLLTVGMLGLASLARFRKLSSWGPRFRNVNA